MSSKGGNLTPEAAYQLISSDYRVHLRRRDSPVISNSDYKPTSMHFDSIEVDSTSQMKTQASKRGARNILRLSKLSSKRLDGEIEELRFLTEHQYDSIEDSFGTTAADKFYDLGLGMAAKPSVDKYRTDVSSSYETKRGKKVEASGYDEFAQTSVVASRAAGRLNQLNYLESSNYDSDKLDQLHEIHRLMSVTSSLARADTAGIASENDIDSLGTRTQHPTKKSMRVTGGGSNSAYAHRMRTGIMQHVESSFIAEQTFGGGQHPFMADIQRARLDAATLATTHIFNAPVTDNTFSAMRKENASKMDAISGTRSVAKKMRKSFATSSRDSFLDPPPSP